MADIVVPDAGCRWLLDTLLRTGTSLATDWRVRLYVNDYTPGRATLTGDFTEATYSGYAPVSLTRALWAPAVTLDDTAYATYNTTPTRFTCSSGEYTIYGYFAKDQATGITLWCQRFNLPLVTNPNAPIDFQPQMRMLSLFAPP